MPAGKGSRTNLRPAAPVLIVAVKRTACAFPGKSVRNETSTFPPKVSISKLISRNRLIGTAANAIW